MRRTREPVVPPPVQNTEAQAPAHVEPDLATTDVLCKQCGFNLHGLQRDGNCPECGLPIWRSIAGNLLKFSSAEYVAGLSRGLACVLIAVVGQLAMTLLAIPIGILIMVTQRGGGASNTAGFSIGSNDPKVELAMALLSLPLTMLALYGWWQFSAPDPGVQSGDRGDRPRARVRAATIILFVTTVVSAVAQTYSIMMPLIKFVVAGVALVTVVASLMQVFASLSYIKWLGARFPDAPMVERAGKYMWLLPLIYVLGICVVVGPLVATVMYFLFLNRVRLRLNEVRREEAVMSAPA